MSPLAMSAIVFAFIFGGTLLGMVLRVVLPEPHLSADTKDAVRLATGLVGTIAALELGLLIASAKTSYDTQSTQVQQMTADVILLDGLLARYGDDARPARLLLRRIAPSSARLWSGTGTASGDAAPYAASAAGASFFDMLEGLSQRTEMQRSLRSRAIQTATAMAKTRLMVFAQAAPAIPMPFLAVLVLWLTIIFASFSLFVRPNATVVVTLLVCALSASTSIFLILELSQPFSGLIQISTAELTNALAPLGP